MDKNIYYKLRYTYIIYFVVKRERDITSAAQFDYSQLTHIGCATELELKVIQFVLMFTVLIFT